MSIKHTHYTRSRGLALTAAVFLSIHAPAADGGELFPTFDAPGRIAVGATLDKNNTGNLYVGPISTGDYVRTFLTFDLSGQFAATGATTLTFAVTGVPLNEGNTSSNPQTFTLYSLASDWDGAAAPGPDPGTVLATVSFTPTTGDDTQPLSFSSEALTTAFNDALGGNLYLGIKSDAEGTNVRSFKWMASREDPGLEPRLTFSLDTKPLAIKDILVDATSNIHLLLAATPGSPYRVYRSNDLQGPLYRKRWSERFVGAFPAGVSEVPLSESMGTEPRGFFVASQSEAKARILCLGDSITEGNETMVVYKGPLYDKLTTAGYRFKYVGSKSSAYTSPTYGTQTLLHEGYSAKNCTQIAGFFATNFPLYPADIVIIHAAHNLNIAEAVLDAAAEAAIVTTVENATRAMIQTARNTNPAAKILLAKVITSGKLPKYSYIPAVNVRLGEIAAELNTAAQPVISVDQAAGFDWTTDTITDKVHPNAAGGEKMAQKFFNALVPLLE